jgi:hypothetical protein
MYSQEAIISGKIQFVPKFVTLNFIKFLSLPVGEKIA